MRWLVERPQNMVDNQVQIEAAALRCEDGMLIFTQDSEVLRAFAPGQWSTVERIL